MEKQLTLDLLVELLTAMVRYYKDMFFYLYL